MLYKARREFVCMRWPEVRWIVYAVMCVIAARVSAAESGNKEPEKSILSPSALEQPGLGSRLAQPPEAATLFASPTRMDRIGRILVPVSINGRGPFRMLVDTGAASYATPMLSTDLRFPITPE